MKIIEQVKFGICPSSKDMGVRKITKTSCCLSLISQEWIANPGLNKEYQLWPAYPKWFDLKSSKPPVLRRK
ncbi:hypothetical protein MANES_14G131200v8 [Manihot esculenta]|uniref:Uncharacterized protein n=1 Tax=Manihot esculenta TaxID=3983 RepID=A0A251JU48_MANES|nr:hypothetical protein MANES_14G131200v8 [Manihot esculenta]